MTTIDEGRQIDRSDKQSSKADPPRIEILEPVSNVTVERAWQLLKVESEIVSIDDGIQID
jgi:hypothetical protein